MTKKSDYTYAAAKAADAIIDAERGPVSEAVLLSASRDAYLVYVRARIAKRLRTELKWSYPRIGARLGYRDHATIMNAVRQHDSGAFRPVEQGIRIVKRAAELGYRGEKSVPAAVSDALALEFGARPTFISATIHGGRLRAMPRPWRGIDWLPDFKRIRAPAKPEPEPRSAMTTPVIY